jgi:thiol-disulfide isomerase/thioredoxin
MRRRPALGPLLALALATALAPARARAAEDEVQVGLPAPSFSLRALDPSRAGAPFVALDHYVGADPEDPGARAVLLSFFASWCIPCAEELPYLAELDRRHRADGLRILSVAIDPDEAGAAAAREMAERAGVRHPVLWDRLNLLARRYLGDRAPLPSVFLVGRDGTVLLAARGYGADAPALLGAEVRRALGLPPAAPPAAARPR